jgi:hypothetical protein
MGSPHRRICELPSRAFSVRGRTPARATRLVLVVLTSSCCRTPGRHVASVFESVLSFMKSGVITTARWWQGATVAVDAESVGDTTRKRRVEMKPRSPAPEEQSVALTDLMIENPHRTEMCEKPCRTGFLGRCCDQEALQKTIRQNLFSATCKLLLLKRLVSFSVNIDSSCHSQWVQ